MKKYRVNVNGTDYEIAVELIEESEAQTSSPIKAAPSGSASTSAGSEKITSPMPGTILNLNVATGDVVKRGQILMILEAMKMENEIMSPVDGTIVSLHTTKGATVESGALLCVIK